MDQVLVNWKKKKKTRPCLLVVWITYGTLGKGPGYSARPVDSSNNSNNIWIILGEEDYFGYCPFLFYYWVGVLLHGRSVWTSFGPFGSCDISRKTGSNLTEKKENERKRKKKKRGPEWERIIELSLLVRQTNCHLQGRNCWWLMGWIELNVMLGIQ